MQKNVFFSTPADIQRRSPLAACVRLGHYVLLLCALIGVASLRAQVLYGTLIGTVTDQSGAVVPGVSIRAVQQETGDVRTGVTNATGEYILSTIPSGTYLVTISAPSFGTFQAKDIHVSLNTAVRIDAKLAVESQNQTVTVSADIAGLQTDRADVHHDISDAELQALPQPTRTYEGLIGLLPGVAPPTTNGGSLINPMKAMVIQANGTSGSGTNVRVDGVSTTNPWIQFYSNAVPSTDAIQTVNVVTSTSGADQGMADGASVNVQIKSGTNHLHGELYFYHVDNLLKARPYFLPTTRGLPKLIENNAGGTVGGPILRDKLFFFGSYEGDFLHQSNINIVTVPTDDIRAGRMGASPTPIYDPTTGAADGSGRMAFGGNMIPTARISPIIQKVVALIPEPNIAGAGAANNYFITTPSVYTIQKIDTKFDYNATSKLHMFVRYSDYPYQQTQGTIFGPVLGGANDANQGGNIYALSASGTYVATPHLVFDSLFGLTHSSQHLSPPNSDTKYGTDVLGIPGSNVGTLPAAGGFPRFLVSNYANYGSNYPAEHYLDPVFQYTFNVTLSKGRHNIRAGMEVSQQHMNHTEVPPTGFTFTGGVTSLKGGPSPNQYNSFADFLLGLPFSSTSSLQTVPDIKLRTWQYNPYVSDQWQVSKKVTLAFGSGWEYYPVPTRADRGIEFYNLSAKQYEVCGKGPVPENCGIHVQKTLFSPRAGIAFRATNSDVIRAGFSLNPEQINMYRDGLYSYPTVITSSYSGANSYTAVNPIAAGIPLPVAPDISNGVVALPAGVTFTSDPQNFVRGYAESYNLTVEHDFGHSWLAQIGFVASHTIHQHARYNINYGLPGGGAASQPFYNGTLGTGITGAETIIYPLESMNYNSLQSTLQHRFHQGSNVQVAYTWSKWLGTCCDANGDGQPAIPIPQYFALNYAPMPADRTHNLRVSGITALPFGKNQAFLSNGGIAAAIFGGFRLNAIVSFYTGAPFSITGDATSLNAPGSTQRADRIKSNVAILHGVGAGHPYFDTSAYAPVTTARFGTASFDSLRAPGYANADLGLFREFSLFDRLTMETRVEVLNASNTPHFAAPNANVSSGAAFGTITATSAGSRVTDERFVRLGVKFAF